MKEYERTMETLFEEYRCLSRDADNIHEAMFMLEMTKARSAELLSVGLETAHQRLCTLSGSKKREIMDRLEEMDKIEKEFKLKIDDHTKSSKTPSI